MVILRKENPAMMKKLKSMSIEDLIAAGGMLNLYRTLKDFFHMNIKRSVYLALRPQTKTNAEM